MRSSRWPSLHRYPKAGMAAPLLVLLAVASSAASLTVAEDGYVAIDVHLAADLCAWPHAEMFGALHATMAFSEPRLHLEEHWFLSPKNAEPGGVLPARWVKLHLAGCVTLALSDGDAEARAFADGAGRWHAFPGYETLFPGATTLPFNGSYDELTGGSRNLVTLPLGKAPALRDIHALSRYDPRATQVVELDVVKAALARLKVMTTEALRWKPIREAFSGGDRWDRETFVTEEQARLVDQWEGVSHLLYRWAETGRWEEAGDEAKAAEEIGVHDKEGALAVVDLLKRPRERCIGTDTPWKSRALVKKTTARE